MDFSGLLIIPLSAIVSALVLVGAAAASRERPRLLFPFLFSFGLSIAILQPWRGLYSVSDYGLSAMMLGLIALWVAMGTVLGAAPALLAIAAAKKIRSWAKNKS